MEDIAVKFRTVARAMGRTDAQISQTLAKGVRAVEGELRGFAMELAYLASKSNASTSEASAPDIN